MGRWAGLLCLAAFACGGSELPVASEPATNVEICADPPADPLTPIGYARSRLAASSAVAKSKHAVCVVLTNDPRAAAALAAAGVKLDERAESYAVVPYPLGTLVVGRDPTGALYGALEVAERLDNAGAAALPLTSSLTGAPRVPIRGANLFLVLPGPGESSWWFHDDAFWTRYLDLMADARLDFLDMHGMYDTEAISFPNALQWFATSPSFPSVGRGDRQQNLERLRKIVAQAGARGIRVGLMTYTFGAGSLQGAAIRTYTREAVRELAKAVPGLDRIGFRIGESGTTAEWFAENFVSGLKEAGTGTRVYTRSWLQPKPQILHVAAAGGPDTIVESKFNGEQLGPPYLMAGGLVSKSGPWPHYSYQDYLNGPAPYQFLFQVRAAGTYRLFRYASTERTRRTVLTTTHGGAHGFTLEAAHAYYPGYDFYHAEAGDRLSPFTFERDDLMYFSFGRLGYDPALPAAVPRARVRRKTGTDELWAPLQAASEIIAWVQTSHTCGPDHLHYAPDLEWGGTVAFWAARSNVKSGGDCTTGYHGPFDTFAVASPYEAAEDLAAGVGTSRLRPIDVASLVLESAAAARKAKAVAIDPANVEARDLRRECVALADFGDYFGHKLRAAAALAVFARTGAADYLEAARSEAKLAAAGWQALAADTGYIKPFRDPRRMAWLGFPMYHWKETIPKLATDPTSIDAVESAVKADPPVFAGTLPPASAWLATARGAGPGLTSLDVAPESGTAKSWTVTVKLASPPPEGAKVTLLVKSFDAGEDWKSAATTAKNGAFVAEVAGTGVGALFAVEVRGKPGQGWRYPDPVNATPYLAIAP